MRKAPYSNEIPPAQMEKSESTSEKAKMEKKKKVQKKKSRISPRKK